MQSQSRQRTVCSGIWKLGYQTKCLSSFRDQQGDANSSKRAKCFVYKKTVLTFSLPKKGELQTELSANIDYLVHQNTFALNFQCPSFWFCCIRSKAVCPFFFSGVRNVTPETPSSFFGNIAALLHQKRPKSLNRFWPHDPEKIFVCLAQRGWTSHSSEWKYFI